MRIRQSNSQTAPSVRKAPTASLLEGSLWSDNDINHVWFLVSLGVVRPCRSAETQCSSEELESTFDKTLARLFVRNKDRANFSRQHRDRAQSE